MKFLIASILAAIAFISGCNAPDTTSMDEPEQAPFELMTGAAMKAAPPMAGTPEAYAPAPVAERKVIRSVSLTIEVKHIEEAVDTIAKAVAELEGFIADSHSYEDNAGHRSTHLTIRVPVKTIDDAVTKIKDLGHVREENISGEDVTEQYFDLETRLANAKKLEVRILNLLDQKSESLKDILDVERELARVREEIESMEGRKRFMDDRIDLATIDVHLKEPPGWGRGIFDPLSGTLHRSITTFTASIAMLIVVISAAVPWIALLIVLAWLFLQFLRFWIRRKREAKERKQRHPNSSDTQP